MIVILAASLVATAQTPLGEVDLTVNGVRSGSKQSAVKALGKPLRTKKIGFNECGQEGYIREIVFPGLEIGVLGNKTTTRYYVISLSVTSRSWRISPNIRIGASRASLIKTFGSPIDRTSDRLTYVTRENLGLVTFTLRKGRLIRVEMSETLC